MDRRRYSGNADGIDDPHDILAAEDFAMPAGGDVRRLKLSGNVDGIDTPHDILAAEDFAMPSGPDSTLGDKLRQGAPASSLVLAVAAAAAVLAFAAVRRR